MTTQRDRYQAVGAEAEFALGSRGRVLRNLRGMHSVRAMAQAESEALLGATNRVIDQTDVDQRFTAAGICGMHRLWLGGIYVWAGEYRQVNMMKDGFPFAAVGRDYRPIAAVFRAVIDGTLRRQANALRG